MNSLRERIQNEFTRTTTRKLTPRINWWISQLTHIVISGLAGACIGIVLMQNYNLNPENGYLISFCFGVLFVSTLNSVQ